MRTILPSIALAVLLAFPATGQVISNIIPEGGDVVQVATQYPISDPGASGSDVVWDFSGTAFTSPVNYFIDPATDAPEYLTFPNATHVINIDADGIDIHNFYDFSGGQWAELGIRTVIPTEDMVTTIQFTGPRIAFILPLTTTSSGASGYIATVVMEDFELPTLMNYSWEVDGSGTLILPNATYGDVLRVKGIEISDGFFPQTTTTYTWLKDGIPFPLLSLSISEVDFGTGPETATDAGAMISYTHTGLEAQRSTIQTAVYPNPVVDVLHFRTGEGFGPTTTVSVIDALGRSVLQRTGTDIAPSETGALDVQSLRPGLYLLRVQGSGVASEVRFIKR